ncbi:GIY-YIG nuclease family protein [Patescibacteria group bacterium]
MYYVYVLLGENEKTYVGYTRDLKRRISEHKSKKVYTSRRLVNPKLIYYEAYNQENLAENRERKLKQYGSSYQGLFKRIGLKQP